MTRPLRYSVYLHSHSRMRIKKFMNPIKLKIGEFSKLNNVTVKTLRYYEKVGLIIPHEIDEWTGYRYYTVAQFQIMTKIIYFKKLGFSLDEIKEIIENDMQQPDKELIARKLQECKEEQKRLRWRQEALRSLGNRLRKGEKTMEIIIKTLPAIIVASHRRIINSYNELFDLCPNIIGPEMSRLGCVCAEPGYCFTIDHNKEYCESQIDIEYCEAVTEKKIDSELVQFKELPEVPMAACVSHAGAYTQLPETFAKLYDYLETNGYEIVDFPRFSYIDGVWNKEEECDWLTEIQVPIRKR